MDGVDRRGAGEKELAHRWGGRTGIHHVDGAGDVDVRRLHGMGVAVRDEVHGGEVEHPAWLHLLHQVKHRLPVPDVHPVEPLIGHLGQCAAPEG